MFQRLQHCACAEKRASKLKLFSNAPIQKLLKSEGSKVRNLRNFRNLQHFRTLGLAKTSVLVKRSSSRRTVALLFARKAWFGAARLLLACGEHTLFIATNALVSV